MGSIGRPCVARPSTGGSGRTGDRSEVMCTATSSPSSMETGTRADSGATPIWGGALREVPGGRSRAQSSGQIPGAKVAAMRSGRRMPWPSIHRIACSVSSRPWSPADEPAQAVAQGGGVQAHVDRVEEGRGLGQERRGGRPVAARRGQRGPDRAGVGVGPGRPLGLEAARASPAAAQERGGRGGGRRRRQRGERAQLQHVDPDVLHAHAGATPVGRPRAPTGQSQAARPPPPVELDVRIAQRRRCGAGRGTRRATTAPSPPAIPARPRRGRRRPAGPAP